MDVYSGIVKKAGAINNQSERDVGVKAGTNNNLMTQIFGVSYLAHNFVNAEGNHELVELFQSSDGAPYVYADLDQLNRTDALEFLRRNSNLIFNWNAVSCLLQDEYPNELQEAANKVIGTSNLTIDLATAKLLSKVVLHTISPEEAKILLPENVDSNKVTRDTIFRHLLGKEKRFTFEQYGLVFNGRVFISHFYYSGDNRLKVIVKPADVDVEGNKASFNGITDKETEVKQFSFLKSFSHRLNGEPIVFSRDFSNETVEKLLEEIDDVAELDLLNAIEYVKDRIRMITPEKAGLDHWDDFNAATVYTRLWNELHLSSGEIPKNGLPEKLLRAYAKGDLAAQDFLVINEAKIQMFLKLKKALHQRYQKNAYADDYAQRALELANQEVNGGYSLGNSELYSFALETAQSVLETKTASITTASLDQTFDLWQMYLNPTERDQEVVDGIKNVLLQRMEDMGKETKSKIKSIMKNSQFKDYFLRSLDKGLTFPYSNLNLAAQKVLVLTSDDLFAQASDSIEASALNYQKAKTEDEWRDYLSEMAVSQGINLGHHLLIKLNDHRDDVIKELVNQVLYRAEQPIAVQKLFDSMAKITGTDLYTINPAQINIDKITKEKEGAVTMDKEQFDEVLEDVLPEIFNIYLEEAKNITPREFEAQSGMMADDVADVAVDDWSDQLYDQLSKQLGDEMTENTIQQALANDRSIQEQMFDSVVDQFDNASDGNAEIRKQVSQSIEKRVREVLDEEQVSDQLFTQIIGKDPESFISELADWMIQGDEVDTSEGIVQDSEIDTYGLDNVMNQIYSQARGMFEDKVNESDLSESQKNEAISRADQRTIDLVASGHTDVEELQGQLF